MYFIKPFIKFIVKSSLMFFINLSFIFIVMINNLLDINLIINHNKAEINYFFFFIFVIINICRYILFLNNLKIFFFFTILFLFYLFDHYIDDLVFLIKDNNMLVLTNVLKNYTILEYNIKININIKIIRKLPETETLQIINEQKKLFFDAFSKIYPLKNESIDINSVLEKSKDSSGLIRKDYLKENTIIALAQSNEEHLHEYFVNRDFLLITKRFVIYLIRHAYHFFNHIFISSFNMAFREIINNWWLNNYPSDIDLAHQFFVHAVLSTFLEYAYDLIFDDYDMLYRKELAIEKFENSVKIIQSFKELDYYLKKNKNESRLYVLNKIFEVFFFNLNENTNISNEYKKNISIVLVHLRNYFEDVIKEYEFVLNHYKR